MPKEPSNMTLKNRAFNASETVKETFKERSQHIHVCKELDSKHLKNRATNA
jgi:hypothetical protein